MLPVIHRLSFSHQHDLATSAALLTAPHAPSVAIGGRHGVPAAATERGYRLPDLPSRCPLRAAVPHREPSCSGAGGPSQCLVFM